MYHDETFEERYFGNCMTYDINVMNLMNEMFCVGKKYLKALNLQEFWKNLFVKSTK